MLALVPGACSTPDPIENYLPAGAAPDAASFTGSGGTQGSGGSKPASGAGGAGGSGASGSAGAAGGAGESSEVGGAAGSTGSSTESGGGGGTGGGGPVVDCGEPPVSDDAFTKQNLRAQAADCAMHHYCVFEAHARWLDSTVVSHANDRSEVTLARAREAWKGAMASWSVLELFQFGPAANPSMSAGKDMFQGKGVRDTIYAWPTTARCRVDEQVIGRGFVKHGMDSTLISGRGLYALEALLFHDGSTSACSPGTSTAKTWASLETETLTEYRNDYAVAVADDVVDQIRGLRQTWSPDAGNFREVFVSASGYPSEQESLNVLGWALVYIEKEVKDWKLGLPAGYVLDAPVSEPEAPYAGTATDNLVHNLLGFRALFQGCGPAGEGLGFDDWLVQAGHPELATDIIQAWQSAHAVVGKLPPLHSASQSELDEAYLVVKALTDLLKNELLGAGSPLNLDLPASVEGDTD
ncbi:MAG TPA: imelysin family protein [Aggregatilineales bacterium]|nr:imelysin family protein [Aggregatilineales bacterium]